MLLPYQPLHVHQLQHCLRPVHHLHPRPPLLYLRSYSLHLLRSCFTQRPRLVTAREQFISHLCSPLLCPALSSSARAALRRWSLCPRLPTQPPPLSPSPRLALVGRDR